MPTLNQIRFVPCKVTLFHVNTIHHDTFFTIFRLSLFTFLLLHLIFYLWKVSFQLVSVAIPRMYPWG